MAGRLQESGKNRTRHEIVKFLKMEGASDASRIAKRLRLTTMAVRQHLYELQEQKLVSAEERPVRLGRPAKYWHLTRKADRLFPQAYAELSVSLIDALKNTFGDAGLKQVLKSRYSGQLANYAERIPASLPLKEKVMRLAKIRTDEGYMSEVRTESGGGFLLIENHCPICTAATVCKGFCTTELDLFRAVLGPAVVIERVEHITEGDRRCAYRISAPVPRPAVSGSPSWMQPTEVP
jgi:predicted ArsR family transcriptional regulator